LGGFLLNLTFNLGIRTGRSKSSVKRDDERRQAAGGRLSLPWTTTLSDPELVEGESNGEAKIPACRQAGLTAQMKTT